MAFVGEGDGIADSLMSALSVVVATYSLTAYRSAFSPKRISLFRHSDLTERDGAGRISNWQHSDPMSLCADFRAEWGVPTPGAGGTWGSAAP